MSWFLVTTADKRTWDLDKKTVFLGGWCLKFQEEELLNKTDMRIAPPYGTEFSNKLEDSRLSKNMQVLILPKLSILLNRHHQTEYSVNFWKIVLGHWLKYFIDIIINRSHTLAQVNHLFNIQGAALIELTPLDFIPRDTQEMFYFLETDEWNSSLDLKILQDMDDINFFLRIIRSSKFTVTQPNLPLKKNSKTLLARFVNLFVLDREPFIQSSYLPFWQQFKLYLSFGTIPKFWQHQNSHHVSQKPNLVLRKKLTYDLLNMENNIYTRLIFDILPICFLEGFQDLLAEVENSGWPTNPKFIFTSNEFLFNERFKIYSASCQESGSLYVIGQHGNNNGTNLLTSPSIEEETSNLFLTWGWRGYREANEPTFVLTIAGKHITYNKTGEILFNSIDKFSRLATWDTDWDYERYIDEMRYFLSNLNPDLFEKFVFRCYRESSIPPSKLKHDLLKLIPQQSIQGRDFPILQQYEKTRLVIHSYDSTGLLETLAMNIPTLSFWQDGLSHLNDSSRVFHERLVDVGIIFCDSGAMAKKVNEIWSDVESWWWSPVIQIAREQFCAQYARTSKNPIRDLRKIIRGNLTN